jgi:hypothetical protein
MPDDAPFTPLATVCTILFSMMLRRRSMPRSMPNPSIAASSEPSMEKPSISAA